MVGPRAREWKVLRETDGERFVVLKKGDSFKENLQTQKYEIDAKQSV
jgi:hypothetical protein